MKVGSAIIKGVTLMLQMQSLSSLPSLLSLFVLLLPLRNKRFSVSMLSATSASTSTSAAFSFSFFFFVFLLTIGNNAKNNNNNNNNYFTFVNGLTESERLKEYKLRNYTWPLRPTDFVPNTSGWATIMGRRLRQAEQMKTPEDRYRGLAQTLSAAMIQQNYTQHGFGLVRAPDNLIQALRTGIQDTLQQNNNNNHNDDDNHNQVIKQEKYIDGIQGGDRRPLFIHRPDLTKRVLDELQHYPETWVGMELTPVIAYGFRLYQNNNQLYVHVDKAETHVISFILHVDSSEDAEPWPILIEDYHGNTHEIVLTSGDILLYESSKCFHGRPRPFQGSWYTSVFVHYYPKYGYREEYIKENRDYAVPPHWWEEPNTKSSSNSLQMETPLVMHGMAMEEPECPNQWCGTEHSIRWSGPGKEGYIIHPTGEQEPFHPHKINCQDNNPRCIEYAAWESDECNQNPTYMHEHCKKSCGLCSSHASLGLLADEL